MGDGPAHLPSGIVLGDQHDAMALGTAMLDFAPMLDRPGRIASAVGLESRFMILQAVEKGKDRRFILRQADFADRS